MLTGISVSRTIIAPEKLFDVDEGWFYPGRIGLVFEERHLEDHAGVGLIEKCFPGKAVAITVQEIADIADAKSLLPHHPDVEVHLTLVSLFPGALEIDRLARRFG